MEFRHFRKILAFFYGTLLLACIILGFQYANDSDDFYGENYTEFNLFWKVGGREILFPYGNTEEFTIKNTLPQVYGDQYLVIRAFYDTYKAYIDGELIGQSVDNYLFGIPTDAGKKEFWIPLLTEYTGKEISITDVIDN